MDSLPTTNPAAAGWTCDQVTRGVTTMFVARPPSPRHYLQGMTPGHVDGKLGYCFLRPDVAKAVVSRDARVRGRTA